MIFYLTQQTVQASCISLDEWVLAHICLVYAVAHTEHDGGQNASTMVRFSALILPHIAQ